MKVDVVGFILMLQKRASHVFLSVGAWFIIMLARVSVLATISKMPIAFSMLDGMFQTGRTWWNEYDMI